MIVNSEKEFIDSIREYVANGDQVEFFVNGSNMLLGFRSITNKNLEWMFRLTDLKSKISRSFASLFLPENRKRFERAFNHQHEFGLNDPNCKLCLVCEVMEN